jgi:hypothetical protein
MYIITDNDYRIIDTLETKEIVDEKWIKSAHGSLIQLDRVDVVEIESVPENTKYYKDGKFSRRHPEEITKDAETIQKQLDDIDKKSVRDTEDLYDLLIKKGFIAEVDVPFIKQRKDQKKALREALKNIT